MTTTRTEHVRQAREAFAVNKWFAILWFGLRFAMGLVALIALPGLGGACLWVIANGDRLGAPAAIGAAVVLVLDLAALFGAVWRLVLSPAPQEKLAPVLAPSSPPQP